jgi:GxxExxY protein
MVELAEAGLRVQREVGCPIDYKGTTINQFRLDVVVEGLVLVELKAVESILPIHRAQVRSYLKASGLQLALLLNFNVDVLRSGIHRIIMSQH